MNHMLNILITVAGFLAVIGPLVFIHEMGHYLAGRAFGVKADMFSIGMGRELFGWTDRRGTRWKISALPIGGYVKFAGDMGPASEPDPAWLALPAEERARTFQGKPVWQRFLIVAAGPITNFLLAIAVYAGFYAAYGVPQTPTVIAAVIPGSAAQKGGILPGDRILEIDGRRMAKFEDIQLMLLIRPHQHLPVVVERGGRVLKFDIFTGTVSEIDESGNKTDRGMLGVAPAEIVFAPGGPLQIMQASVSAVRDRVRMIIDVVGQIAGGERSAKELGGPLRIAQFSGERVSLGLLPFIDFMALISINLGFINLLPIPLLDGGHLFFYLIEGVRRRPLPAQAQEWAFRSGLALLLGFMLFVTVNDLGSFGLWRKLAGLIG
ncbi:MAG TPA: RIP metalloprotease RseP [Sphingomonas sp.]|nr:RIP metalloprotease RseP [Sphingomonas sp.]